MKRVLVLTFLGIPSLSPVQQADQRAIMGYISDEPGALLQVESRFDSILRSENIEAWIKEIADRPHHVGSVRTREIVERLSDLFKSWGYDTRVDQYQVLFPTPKERVLEMLQPVFFKAGLEEKARSQAATSSRADELLPVYNAFSVDGDVTGELVYVNYGIPGDYEELEGLGVDVRGKLVIARYGGSWRGIKPKVAAERGAVGCIIYSDPYDDGYYQGDVYPDGPYRNEWGAQRGSVADIPLFPGDPLTPSAAATAEAARIKVGDAPTLTRIPVLPISYGDAVHLLEALEGPVAPPSWRGALPLTYHVGPGPAKVRLKVEFEWKLRPALNVIASIPGSQEPDLWIIRGNHHDAWVSGAADPVSGLAAMLEEARAIGTLVQGGWRPRRTIVYAAWDAEEPGLIGSTEWVEHHAEELRSKAAVYVNSDSNGRGFLRVGGSHSLEKFVNEVAKEVVDPQKGVSVWQRWRALSIHQAKNPEEMRALKDLPISALGSGSDYSPFLQHLGVACLNLGFGGENSGGSYHSIHDSVDHYGRFGDPGFQYGVALARVAGRIVIRLASATVLPFEFSAVSRELGSYVKDLESLLDRMRSEAETHNRNLQENVQSLTSDSLQPFVPPAARGAVPNFDFTFLKDALVRLEESSRNYETSLGRLLGHDGKTDPTVLLGLNRILMNSERALTKAEGLPARPWYRHYVYAPGFYTGYGVKTLPAVRETIEERDWGNLDSRMEATASVILELSNQIDRAVELMAKTARPGE